MVNFLFVQSLSKLKKIRSLINIDDNENGFNHIYLYIVYKSLVKRKNIFLCIK